MKQFDLQAAMCGEPIASPKGAITNSTPEPRATQWSAVRMVAAWVGVMLTCISAALAHCLLSTLP